MRRFNLEGLRQSQITVIQAVFGWMHLTDIYSTCAQRFLTSTTCSGGGVLPPTGANTLLALLVATAYIHLVLVVS